jgi:hypothetical protein
MADFNGNKIAVNSIRGSNFIVTQLEIDTGDTLSFTPDANEVWVIQNIVGDKMVTIQYYDAVRDFAVPIEDITLTGGFSRTLEHFPCMASCYVRILINEDDTSIIATGRIEQ